MLLSEIPKKTLKGLIFIYAYAISPLTAGKCRFFPTCSAYAIEAIDLHGAVKGSVMAGKRLCRCHPWHKAEMMDPVPCVIDWREIIGYKRAKPRDTSEECGCANHKMKE